MVFNGRIVIKFDGKQMAKLGQQGHGERLVIIACDELGNSQLLGAIMLNSGKGKDIARALIDTAVDWNILDQVW